MLYDDRHRRRGVESPPADGPARAATLGEELPQSDVEGYDDMAVPRFDEFLVARGRALARLRRPAGAKRG